MMGVPRLRSRRRPGGALVPICQDTKGLISANGRSGSLRVNIDLMGLGQVLPQEVPRTILVRRRTDEIIRADRPAQGRGAAGGRFDRCEAGRVTDRFIARPTRANPPRQVPHQRCGMRAG